MHALILHSVLVFVKQLNPALANSSPNHEIMKCRYCLRGILMTCYCDCIVDGFALWCKLEKNSFDIWKEFETLSSPLPILVC